MAKNSSGSGGDDDLLLALILGGIGGGLWVLSQHNKPPVDVRLRMKSLVQEYRKNPRLRAYVGRLIGGIDPNKPLARMNVLYRAVTDNIAHVGDPEGEFVADPITVLQTRVGDCDCKATCLATLLEAAGYPTKFGFVPGHVYVEVGVESKDSPSIPPTAYRRNDGGRIWVSLEPSAPGANFGWININKVDEAIRKQAWQTVDNR